MSDVVDAIVDAFNRRDLEAFCAGYADEVVIEDAWGGPIVVVAAQLRERYGAMFAAHPELRCEVRTRIDLGEHVVDEELVGGRSPEPERLVVVYRLAGGRVVRERIVR